MEKERKKKQRIERVVKAIFLLILPLVTAALTAFTMADNGSVSEFLTINILTPMFVIWFLSLVIDKILFDFADALFVYRKICIVAKRFL